MKNIEKIYEKRNNSVVVIVIIVLSLVINFCGKYFATTLMLPIWADSLGTCLVACIYGPISGAIVGAALNITYGFFDPVAFMYAVSSVCIGYCCGVLARKKYFTSVYNTFVVGGYLTAISVVVSVPVNLYFYQGYTSNIWGDGIYDMVRESNINPLLAAVFGEFAIDFLDKNLMVIIIYCLIKFKDMHTNKAKENVRGSHQLILVFMSVGLATLLPLNAQASVTTTSRLNEGFISFSVYDDRNGLPGGEANAVAFSNDGFLWIGTYSGLYRYDGANFTPWESDTIKSVNCLFGDEEGRIWVGTNDRGLAVLVNGKVVNTLDESSGLSSNSVSCIGKDNNENYYIGTKGALDVIQLTGGMDVYKHISEVEYAYSISTDSRSDLIAVVTNSGECHIVEDGEYRYSWKSDSDTYTCGKFVDSELWLGTYSEGLLRYSVDSKKYEYLGRKQIGELSHVHSVLGRENDIWVCADNGIGYWNQDGVFQKLNTGNFCTSIDNISLDYQGNIWITSSRQGLLKITPSAFFNIYSKNDYTTDVINAVVEWEGHLYVGSDNGLDVFSHDYRQITSDSIVELTEGQRIRNLMVDSKNHLWISTTTGLGLVEVYPGTSRPYKIHNDKNGMSSSRFRSALELNDGTIAVAEDIGIDFLRGDTVIGSVTADDGLVAPMILSLCEASNGKLYAGTDGGGLAEIIDGQVSKIYTMEDGLSSGVILRITESKDGLFVVTSNGINYVDYDGNITYLDRFPYSNNFAVFEDKNNKAWVLSSAGIYVLDRDELMANQEMNPLLLNDEFGLTGSITANSWPFITDDSEMFVPCDDGCYKVDMNEYMLSSDTYRLSVVSVYADDIATEISDERTIYVGGDSDTLILEPVAPNYTINEVYVGYRLNGYEDSETIISAKELDTIKYQKLPGGEYILTLNLYGSNKKTLLESVNYIIKKEMRIYDYPWFKLYFVLIYGSFMAWITWLLVRRYNNKLMAKEYEKMELMEREARISNETIMAIARTVDAKDIRTSKHSERVADYSALIAKKLGWDEQACEEIYKTGLLHDIGKIGIPDTVLNKPGKLSDEEYALMKTHVDKGAEILKGFTLIKDVDLGARFHHERYDGKGYPQGLKGKDIPIRARIIGLADAFDAMTSNRVYRNQLDIDTVLAEIIRCRGTQFDPEIADIFLQLIESGDIDVEVLYERK